MKPAKAAFATFLLCAASITGPAHAQTSAPAAASGAPAADAPSDPVEPVPEDDLLNATLWMQRAIEYKANSLNVFALAQIRLDEALADKTATATGQTGNYADLPPAIILDLDETVFDNSAYEAGLITTNTDFSSKTYKLWVGEAAAKAIPGAIEFLKYADSKGVKLFYVTNRAADEEEGTRRNMEALGAPMGGNVDTFLMSREKEDWTSKKGTRRDFVSKDYRVLQLFGDNYGDFSDDAAKTEVERLASFEANKAHFAKDWFMLANPTYGSWESAMFAHDFKIPPDQRRTMKLELLETWEPPAP